MLRSLGLSRTCPSTPICMRSPVSSGALTSLGAAADTMRSYPLLSTSQNLRTQGGCWPSRTETSFQRPTRAQRRSRAGRAGRLRDGIGTRARRHRRLRGDTAPRVPICGDSPRASCRHHSRGPSCGSCLRPSGRGAAAGHFPKGEGALLTAAEAKRVDGPGEPPRTNGGDHQQTMVSRRRRDRRLPRSSASPSQRCRRRCHRDFDVTMPLVTLASEIAKRDRKVMKCPSAHGRNTSTFPRRGTSETKIFPLAGACPCGGPTRSS